MGFVYIAFCISRLRALFALSPCIILIGSGLDLVLDLALFASIFFLRWQADMPYPQRIIDILAFPTIL